jgi:hypothetical protein
MISKTSFHIYNYLVIKLYFFVFGHEITLPQNYRQVDIAPGNESFTAPGGSGSVRIKTEHEKNSLTITYEINSHPAILTPEEYSEVNAIGTLLKGKEIKMVLLEK